MDLTREQLDAVRTACRALGGRGLRYDAPSGMLEGTAALTAELYAALDLLIRAGALEESLELAGKLTPWADVPPTSTQQIRVELPVAVWADGSHVVYRNLDALIGRGAFLTQAPAACYLVDEDLLLPQDSPSGPAAGYLQAVELAQLLARAGGSSGPHRRQAPAHLSAHRIADAAHRLRRGRPLRAVASCRPARRAAGLGRAQGAEAQHPQGGAV
jgi:hypothetical protein